MNTIRIGTRDSQLAVWQATLVQNFLHGSGVQSEIIFIKSEGDIDTVTPLYALGVQGIFTKALDAALLNNRIDVAVHSMKDVPTQIAQGIKQAAVLERASAKDILVYKENDDLKYLGFDNGNWNTCHPKNFAYNNAFTVATSSIRRMAQWKNRFPNHHIENLRGNVNTRLRKLNESSWQGAIFAAAGLERINLRPEKSVDLDWMLPAPAQGAIVVVCRDEDNFSFDACQRFNHKQTALCTKIERDFLCELMGGCSTPISAFAQIRDDEAIFEGNIVSPDGTKKVSVEKRVSLKVADNIGITVAHEIMNDGGREIMQAIRNKRLSVDE